MKDLGKIYSGKRVFLTGHTGFKGAWLALWLSELGAKVFGYSLEESPSPASYSALAIHDLLSGEEIADITDRQKLEDSIRKFQPDIIFHLAAQSLVRQSYVEPLQTLDTNFFGTANVLESLRRIGKPSACVIVTSDKCYENREIDYAYREDDPMGGHDIYSMSKGACELLTASYRHSFFHPSRLREHGIAVASARSGNVIGGGDYAQDRIIPDCVRALRANQIVVLRNPSSIRPWQHVLEPLSGYLQLGARLLDRKAEFCEAWNFGPAKDRDFTVRELVDRFLASWGSGKVEMPVLKNQPHEAHLLKLDITKAQSLLHWTPRWKTEEAVYETALWYKRFEESSRTPGSMKEFTIQQIAKYS